LIRRVVEVVKVVVTGAVIVIVAIVWPVV